MFAHYLARWGLTVDGTPTVTHSSRLVPVQRDGVKAMLKVAVEEERFGGLLMEWWDGEGAARVMEREGPAILLERAEDAVSLADVARKGDDDEASRIICDVVARLHAPRAKPLPELIPLSQWFRDLEPAASAHSGILSAAAATARMLLADPRDACVLHGDIHHDNILDFGERGWLAIDPKGLRGERGFDYANLFCNPDEATATAPGRLARRVAVVSKAAALPRERLLQWILAWAGLSAVWFLADGEPPGTRLAVAELAEAELGR